LGVVDGLGVELTDGLGDDLGLAVSFEALALVLPVELGEYTDTVTTAEMTENAPIANAAIARPFIDDSNPLLVTNAMTPRTTAARPSNNAKTLRIGIQHKTKATPASTIAVVGRVLPR
jgi:hypothetical protein